MFSTFLRPIAYFFFPHSCQWFSTYNFSFARACVRACVRVCVRVCVCVCVRERERERTRYTVNLCIASVKYRHIDGHLAL